MRRDVHELHYITKHVTFRALHGAVEKSVNPRHKDEVRHLPKRCERHDEKHLRHGGPLARLPQADRSHFTWACWRAWPKAQSRPPLASTPLPEPKLRRTSRKRPPDAGA